MTDAMIEEMSSGDIRDQILSQHVTLRTQVAELAEIAERVANLDDEPDALRARAGAFYDALASHMTFEEQVLAAALRDVIGWGAVIQQKLEEDHHRQREMLAGAIAALGPTGLSGVELVENVRAFASTLLVDMDSEERGFMQADLDAIAADARGG